MPILDIPNRVVKFTGAALPTYPAHVVVQAQLAPKELFGEEALSGRLSVFPPGCELKVRPDMWHGGVVPLPTGRLPRVAVTCPFFDLSLRIEGSLAAVEGELTSEDGFKRCIAYVASDLAAILSGALQGPVSVCEVFGTVADQFFTVEVAGTFERSVKTVDAAVALRQRMDLLARLPESGADRVFAAFRYINHSRWLSYVETFPAQFAGEQLLNLNKAIEALFPHGDMDALRTTLRSFGIKREVIELLVSIGYVRNQIDVGHSAIDRLSPSEHEAVHRFLSSATELVAWLVDHAIAVASKDDHAIRAYQPRPNKDRDRTFAAVTDLLWKVNPLHPNTFMRKPGEANSGSPPPPVPSSSPEAGGKKRRRH